MELWIIINKCSKQLTGISRYECCYFQDGIQYKFPYLVRNRQLERFISSISKECPDGFIRFKPLYCAEYVILHQGQRKTCNLCREMDRLASAKVQKSLAIAICTLGSPTHRINFVGLKEAEFHICSEQSIPLTITSSLAEEQSYSCYSILYVYGTIGTFECRIMLAETQFMEFPDNLLGG